MAIAGRLLMRNLLAFLHLSVVALAAKYPNEIQDSPLVLCEQNHIVIKIKTTSSEPSLLYAEDFAEDAGCASRNKNSLKLQHGKCGMSTERTTDPVGAVQRVCVSVQMHPLFVTEADRSYCVQCVYVEQHVLTDLDQSIAVSDATATELEPIFDFDSVPKCSYSIRKGSPTGPAVHYAAVGDAVFHVWKCEGGGAGMLVQNCYVEDGQSNRILIIDQNGCGVDHYVMDTPEYSEDLTSAFQETHVFKFAQRTIARFACQIRICIQGEDCHTFSPPRSCPSRESRIAETRDLSMATSILPLKPVSLQTSSEEESDLPLVARQQNGTIGTVFFGAGSRLRRDSLSLPLPPPLLRRSRGRPEFDVVGELRVLDSAEDVQYFERQLASAGEQSACLSSLSYSILVSSVAVLSLLFLTLILLLLQRITPSRRHRHAAAEFPH